MAASVVTRDHRRGKTALFLIFCGWAGAAPHWFAPGRSLLPAITLAFFLGGYGLRTVLRGHKKWFENSNSRKSQTLQVKGTPQVDVLVAARDEEKVIRRLVEGVQALSYPKEKLSIWIIDDGSQDGTSCVLEDMEQQLPNLNVIRRTRAAGGGKSGALNEALRKLKGDWLLILDADAQLQEDSLERLVLFAQQGGWSAVQLRKSVVNAESNLLTRCQAMEMAMDAFIQQGRLAGGGVVELRGNGQLLRRSVVEECGGFNEDTVTDDLDLSFRFLISGALVSILWDPPVQEEAVETFSALWKQRQRWAEGGLQRFFDYWPLLISGKLTFHQRRDLACFFLLQYALPVISFSDLITTIFTRTIPAYWPLSIVAFSISGLAYWRGCITNCEGPTLPSPRSFSLILSIAYLAHWFIVIPWVTVRMALFPKKLIWAKTNHHGENTLKA